MTERVFIVEALRTPIGKFGGALKDIDAIDLTSEIIKGLVERSSISPKDVDEVHLGCCINYAVKDGAASVIARQALIKAGLDVSTISSTIDKACCSSTEAIRTAVRTIRLGEADVVIAGGVETMSSTPHLNRRARWGARVGAIQLEDPIFPLGYKDFNPVAIDAGEVALEYEVSRDEQDQWAYRSQMRYQEAEKEGKFNGEIIPINITNSKGNIKVFDKDEFPKPHTTLEGLKKLKTVFGSPTVTAGNAPGLNDGAAGLLFMSEGKVKELNITPLAEVMAVECCADEPKNIATVPGYAIKKVLDREKITVDDLKLIEINEAFAAMPLVSSKILGDFQEEKIKEIRNKTNVNGGSIAMGHPVGASGARILITLLHELRRTGGGYGASAICGGLAQGDAILIKI